MVFLPRGLMHGLSAVFRALLDNAVPEVLDEERFMSRANDARCNDFMELFSGSGHLTQQMRAASCLHCFPSKYLFLLIGIRVSPFCQSFS